MIETCCVSVERIRQAAKVIDPVFLSSPQFRAEPLERSLDCRLVIKVETLNPIRSFKGRGTEFLLDSLKTRPHLVCATAGNFGQGMGYSARKRGLALTIYTAVTTTSFKIDRMLAFGADVRVEGQDFDAAHKAARAFAKATGAQLIEDGREPTVAEGAGTIGLELLEWPEPFDAILVPLGDGALLAGVARWIKTHHPATQMIGACSAGAPAMERSWRSGKLLQHRAETIAEGVAVQSPFPESLANMTGIVDDILLVEDATLIGAMRLAHREFGLVLEPAGAAGLAALMTNRDRFVGRTIGIILTGGNITIEQMRQWL